MATVGTRLTIPFTVGTSQIVGQGNTPELWCLYTTDDASATSPTWNTVPWTDVRSFSVSRGRENELSEVDAGTATITLDNRDRNFDPSFNTAIRPMNRWWLREQFSGETQDLFLGYAESYEQSWPGTGVGNAETVVSCADEFKVLALDKLPVMSPPRDTYQDLVMSDEPTWYVTFEDATLAAAAGPTLRIPATGGGGTIVTGTAVIGNEYTSDSPGGYLSMPTTGQFIGDSSEGGDAQGDRNFTVEFWVRTPGGGAGARVVRGPSDPGAAPPSYSAWSVGLSAASAILFTTYNAGGGSFVTLTSSVLSLNTWHHIVCTCDTSFMRIYIDGVLNTSIAGPASIPLAEGWDPATIGLTTNSISFDFDEFAFYRSKTLDATRIAAHYQAGTVRGYDQQLSGTRVNAVLDTVTSIANRNIQTGSRTVQARFMHGQSPMDELRDAERAEMPDGLLFVNKSGAITLLAADHRSSSPYNTVQATFDDDGTDLPYADLTVDYSEAFLFNDWNVTREGRVGVLQNAQDATSLSRYKKRSQSITDVPVTTNAQASTIGSALLAKYKDPFQRVTTLALDASIPDVTEAVFRRDLGDRIRVFRTPPGGGSRIDQTLFIQKIQIDGDNSLVPWRIQWAVSPL